MPLHLTSQPTDTVCEVVISGVPKRLFYSRALCPDIRVGYEVTVPVGNCERRGWVIRLLNEGEIVREEGASARVRQLSFLAPPQIGSTLKPVIEAVPSFAEQELPLFAWVSDYYGYPLAEVLETAIPARGKRTGRATPHVDGSSPPTDRRLTGGQERAVSAILDGFYRQMFSPFLLYGVTGSGKTEVYLTCIETILQKGENALIIVPEIALTPQLIDQFQSRLSLPLGVLHSQVAPGLRRATWDRLLSGELRIALGARSAVFAPVRDPGLIVVDEEHETSYKQSDGVRYHARDVAVMRARFLQRPIVLGSATPSLESLLNVQRRRCTLLEMPERATPRPVPQVAIVDLSAIRAREMPSPNISPRLREAMEQTLSAKGQAILLYNRRGFSTYLQCNSCGEVVMCPDCSIPLTFHKGRSRLLCHYCGTATVAPEECRFCRDPRLTRPDGDEEAERQGILSHRGGGTERIVEELGELFPQARILRMDRDTVGRKDSYRRILGAMRAGSADILVGTQMIAKGHDLPGVTLVGIINADVGLQLPDFRSSERTYQLITQAAGRAGRGTEEGSVLVQTYQPNHPTIVATATGRFKAFARYQLQFREELHYPPFGRLMRVVISSPKRGDLERMAPVVEKTLRGLLEVSGDGAAPKFQILGPAMAPHEKLRSRFRMHFLVKSPSAKLLSATARGMRSWRVGASLPAEFRVTVDVDPHDLL